MNNITKSPIFISSKTVPDLHNKILAKIRLNKRRSQTRSLPNQSPCKATELLIPELHRPEDPDCSDRKSPVSGQELDTYLASMFFMVYTDR